MSAKETLGFGIQVEGIAQTLKALNKLSKEGNKAAKAEAMKIAEVLASRIRARLNSSPDPRYRALAASVRVGSDRVPVIRIGALANPKVSGGGGPRELVIGLEFGADQSGPNGWRFPPRTPRFGRGNHGYYIFPTARVNQREIVQMWFDAMDKLLDDWAD